MKIGDRYRIDEGTVLRLTQHDPAEASLFDEADASSAGSLATLSERLNELEDVLSAVQKQSVLVVLQGMDGSGKDEIICDVFRRVNPSRLRVAAFGEPNEVAKTHDFLWRVHDKVPACGEIVIFDRSHYEGVLVERVHQFVKPALWRRRYGQIRAFEETLADHDTLILKFFLHMSKKEQKRRLEERLCDPTKSWKFAESDLRERKLWTQYMRAYEQAISETSTSDAPWFVIPSDLRWHRDLVVASIVVEAIEALKLRYPKPAVRPEDVFIR